MNGTSNQIESVIGVNEGEVDVVSYIIVNATSEMGCVGEADTFSVTIHPTPIVTFTGDILSGCEPHNVVFTSETNIPVSNCE